MCYLKQFLTECNVPDIQPSHSIAIPSGDHGQPWQGRRLVTVTNIDPTLGESSIQNILIVVVSLQTFIARQVNALVRTKENTCTCLLSYLFRAHYLLCCLYSSPILCDATSSTRWLLPTLHWNLSPLTP